MGVLISVSVACEFELLVIGVINFDPYVVAVLVCLVCDMPFGIFPFSEGLL